MRRIALTLLIGCSGSPTVVEQRLPHHGPPVHCPPPKADDMESAGAPPWERDPLGQLHTCTETDDGARVTVRTDPHDRDGWSEFLRVEDGGGKRFERDIRAANAMAIAPDGGVVLAHTEDAVSRYAPNGALLWKTPHPYCGYAQLSVGHDGRVVLACGYSLVAYSADGTFLWHKWPFGNEHVGRVMFERDGTMIVRSGSTVASLDASGAIRWRVETGANRYVLPLGVQADGTLVFRTSMAESHTPGDVHYYYEYEPDELFAITRAGQLVSRRKLDGEPAWPSTLPWTVGFRAGRLP